jgi:glycosylphosphatidylinositol transamidase (GPIT) subunit GPI8
VVKEEVLTRNHRSLLIMGAMHFLRNSPMRSEPSTESRLRRAGAKTYQSSAKSFVIDAGDEQRDDVNTRCLQDISKIESPKIELQKLNIEARVELS